ncbi:PadR family transcriptional regulator PadR [Fontibacillus solani]|uniref:PadR family transcriptional regulator PadR n=1 Tax=Fontibacillus solani TaxID=1572857 RepID=A0A7W3SQI1_9BACL|nr:PadR family transcriptional regulator [Fontibacillus solani]MBA9084277.1 PadR family transcriptional regulator PadR [Fontibacillus solani]
MNVDEWKSQLKRGILEYSILLLIKTKSYYGYEIISEISQWDIIAAKESTVYPLLRRLEKEHYLASMWKDSVEGLPPRKYYMLTDKGKEYVALMSNEWGALVGVIHELQNREEENNG